jgi:hypothetical protein
MRTVRRNFHRRGVACALRHLREDARSVSASLQSAAKGNVMPSGGNTCLNEPDWEFVRANYDAACKHGLQYEYLQWFLGGLVEDKLPIREASNAACIEWDF